MANPIIRPSCNGIPCSMRLFNPIFNFYHSSKPYSSTLNYKKCLCCMPSAASNPVSSEEGLCLSIGTHQIPHPDKVEKGGEDAFFVSSYKGGVIAVADGVSGWAEKDVDPAMFSRELMASAYDLVEDEEVKYDPRNLIRKAHASTSSIGSATVIVAMLERNGILKIANVGDCGLRVIRKGQVVFSTCPQEHYFDCPYQLSSEAVTQTYLDATVSTVELVEEDIVVIGSDGLFDNIFDREIVSVVCSLDDPAEAAKALAQVAHDHSKDSNFDSPYSQEARARGFDTPWWKQTLGMKLKGGKLDDITVVVGQAKSFLMKF